ncbi:MAG: hypothetical protein RI885_506 [Actinomycetota bacterium]
MYPSAETTPFERTILSLARADDVAAAVEHVAEQWESVVATDGAAIRRALDALPEHAWSSDPRLLTAMGASYRSLDRRSRSAALPWFRTALAIAEKTDAAASVHAMVLLHHAAALRSLGRLDLALDLGRRAWELLDGDTSPAASRRVRGQAFAALQLGLVLVHLGRRAEAGEMLHLAWGLADRALNETERFECVSGLALLAYLDGDLARSAELSRLARSAEVAPVLLHTPFGVATLIAETLVAVMRDDGRRAAELEATLADAAARSDWEPFAHYARGMVADLEGRRIEGLELVRKALDAAKTWTGEPTVFTCCAVLRGLLLTHLGEFAAALNTFASVHPDADHATCPNRFIAGIRYKAGDSAGCLRALEACDALGEAHSPRTVIDVLMLKAAAGYDVDNPTAADVALDRALLLASQGSMRTPFLMISPVTMQRMLGRASDRGQPESVHRLLDELRLATSVPSAGTLEPLSVRERDIAQHLFEDKTVSQIASELFISSNTVKTHVRSIYRKLSANNRRDAVRRVRELGLVADITPV